MNPLSLPLFPVLQAMQLPRPQGILQVGASYGQEIGSFVSEGIRAGVFIEPLPAPFAHLAALCQRIPGYVAVNTLCTDEGGRDYEYYLASNGGMSSSILRPARHLEEYAEVSFEGTTTLRSTTLDDVMTSLQVHGHGDTAQRMDTLYMDTQGSELKILMGANRTLKRIRYIYTEVMRGNLYEGQPEFFTVCHWLDAAGFTLNNVYFHRQHAGDALFIRKDVLGLTH